MSESDPYITAIDIWSVGRHSLVIVFEIECRVSNHLLREYEVRWLGIEAKLDIFDAKINESKCELY